MQYSKSVLFFALAMISLGFCCKESQAKFSPPKDAPQGATRGTGGRGECDNVEIELEPLVPSNTWGLTLKQSQRIWVYVKYGSLKSNKNMTGTFTLEQRKPTKGNPIRNKIELPKNSSVFSIPIETSLQDNAWYNWTLELSCKNKKKTPPYTSGVISRKNSVDLMRQFESSSDLISFYENHYLWYDVLDEIAKLQCSNPGNLSYRSTWANLMNTKGINLSNNASQAELVCK
jgi:hypothetical protein